MQSRAGIMLVLVAAVVGLGALTVFRSSTGNDAAEQLGQLQQASETQGLESRNAELQSQLQQLQTNLGTLPGLHSTQLQWNVSQIPEVRSWTEITQPGVSLAARSQTLYLTPLRTDSLTVHATAHGFAHCSRHCPLIRSLWTPLHTHSLTVLSFAHCALIRSLRTDSLTVQAAKLTSGRALMPRSSGALSALRLLGLL